MEIGGVHVLMVDPYNEWHKVQKYDQIHDTVTTLYQNLFTNRQQIESPAEPILEIEAIPNASTVLRERSWIYFGVNSSDLDANAVSCVIAERLGLTEAHENSLGVLSRLDSVSMLIPFMPEFLFFDFPAHCTNAILGPAKFATSKENALDLRKVFRINVAGIVHPDNTVSWWPGASRQRDGFVGAGDRGLVMRVPEWGAGNNSLAVQLEDIHDLMDVERFRMRLGLDTDEAAWRTWQRNASPLKHTFSL